jgi:hypothetical protein
MSPGPLNPVPGGIVEGYLGHTATLKAARSYVVSHHLTETYPWERALASGKYPSRDELVASVSTAASLRNTMKVRSAL